MGAGAVCVWWVASLYLSFVFCCFSGDHSGLEKLSRRQKSFPLEPRVTIANIIIAIIHCWLTEHMDFQEEEREETAAYKQGTNPR